MILILFLSFLFLCLFSSARSEDSEKNLHELHACYFFVWSYFLDDVHPFMSFVLRLRQEEEDEEEEEEDDDDVKEEKTLLFVCVLSSFCPIIVSFHER